MQIIRIIARLNIGGPALHTVMLTRALADLGYCTTLIVGEVPAGEGSAEYLARQSGVEICKVPALSRSVSLFNDFRAFIYILQTLRRKRPDLVHTHTAKAGALGRLAAWLVGIPVVHTFHGHVFHGYFSPFKTRWIMRLERFLARRSACIIAISQSQKKELAEIYRIAPAHKIRIVPLGFDLRPFVPIYENRNDAFLLNRIGWVGRMTAVKEPRMFPAIAAEIVRQGPGFQFSMVGGGELRNQVSADITQLGIKNECQLWGWRHDMPDVYRQLDLLCLTSRNEGTPVAMIEAMASGCLVVASAVGGVSDLLGAVESREEGFSFCRHGVLVLDRRPVIFARAVNALLRDLGRGQAMRRAAYVYAMSHFSQESLIKNIHDLYSEIVPGSVSALTVAAGL